MTDVLSELQKLIAELPKDVPGSSIELLLQQMEPETARLLRLCAIPHYIDPTIIATLSTDIDVETAHARFLEFMHLPMMMETAEGNYSLHDEARGYLFQRWLAPEHSEEFSTVSARLVVHFHQMIDAAGKGTHNHDLGRHLMFHAFGIDEEQGFAEFERLWANDYSEFHLGGCKVLIRLVHEYDRILTPQGQAWLAYHEALLAVDMCDWQEAERLLKQTLDGAIASGDIALQIKVYARLGMVMNRQKRWKEAISWFGTALRQFEKSDVQKKMHPVLYGLGVAHREIGDLEPAEKYLSESLRYAKDMHDLSAMADSYNGLGSLYLRQGAIRQAIECYEGSLDCILQGGQVFRSAQVYNNLGMAYAELSDWNKSEQFHSKSLQIKEQAGDTLGQATTLNNLITVYENQGRRDLAIDAAIRAADLFKTMRDDYCSAVAQKNLGKLYRKAKQIEPSRQAFSAAIALFERCAATREANAIRKEMTYVSRRIPWWAWLPLGIFLLILGIWIYFMVVTPVDEDASDGAEPTVTAPVNLSKE